MPFMYGFNSKMVAENYATSGSANTEINFGFIKPGSTRFVALMRLATIGKGAALTTLSGISVRVKQWTTTASSGGTAVTPSPKNNVAPACAASAGLGASGGTGAITPGTGGPSICDFAGMGGSGPGGFAALNPDDGIGLDGGANKSIDLFSSSPTASMNFEFGGTLQECN